MYKNNIPLDSAYSHVTGESIFIDDRPVVSGEVFLDCITSPIAHGKVKSIDVSEALKLPKLLRIFTYKDLHENMWGTIFQDQPILVEDEFSYAGEPILLIVAEDRATLRKAKKLIKIEVEKLPAILSIDKAIEEKSFIASKRVIQKGNVDKVFENSENIIEGILETEGQEQFYLESQACIAYPGERGQIEVHSSSQNSSEVQHVVAKCLGLKFNQVICIVKRMGGGFGGKESQAVPFAVMASLVASKLNRPARLVLTKDEDMIITGKRHPYKDFYKVAFDSDGKITALKVEYFSDGGAYADLSTSILERTLLHTDNAYYLENVHISGQICKTNYAPNTAFRGFGGPQAIAMIENIMEEIAIYLKKDSIEVRKLNLYQIETNNTTPYGQVVKYNTLGRLFSELEETSNYKDRLAKIIEFNKKSKTYIKGLSFTPVKFGISFTSRFLNQGNALVNVHLDGTVHVSTGATEMGQGVNTKISQVVAECFSISPQDIIVLPTSTDKNANTSPTAASSGADINCSAALIAAEKIKKRLSACASYYFEHGELTAEEEIEVDTKEIATEHIQFEDNIIFNKNNPEQKLSFPELVKIAYFNRINLNDYGFYKTKGIWFDRELGQGVPFLYFTIGGAVSEVSVERLSGEVKVIRTDILMDLGRTINHGIDYGQVSGAFVQGMGWVTTEKLKYNNDGLLLSHSPTTYKIPNIQDIPRIFNIKLLENSDIDVNVKRTKAVGEPPFVLSVSVWTAIKHALSFVNPDELPRFKLPATSEEVLFALKKLGETKK